MTRSSTLFMLSASALLLLRCPPNKEDRLEAVYTANGNLVAKNTELMFNQSIQQGGYALLAGSPGVVSVTRKNTLSSSVVWDVEAYDATGGSPQFKIRVIPTLAGAATNMSGASTIIDGGRNTNPALAVLNDVLYVIWECDNGVCLSKSADGQNWSAAVSQQLPNGTAKALDLIAYDGHLHVAGVNRVAGTNRLFAAQIHLPSTGNTFACGNVVDDVVPGDHPSSAEAVSLATDGSHLLLGYVRDNTSRLTTFDGTSWSLTSGLIHEFSGGTASRASLAVVGNRLYACFRNGSVLSVKSRLLTANVWEPGSFHVNDAQADATAGIECQKIQVFVN
jgi:hypothetical protein